MRQRFVGVLVLAGLAAAGSMVRGQEISKGLNVASVSAGFKDVSGDDAGYNTVDVNVTAERLWGREWSAGLALDWTRLGADYYSESWGAVGPLLAVYLTPGKDGSPYVSARATFGFGGDGMSPDGKSGTTLGVGVGYLKLFGSERAGAGVRVEAGYRHEKYGKSIIGDIIYPEGSRNHARLDVGLTFYLH